MTPPRSTTSRYNPRGAGGSRWEGDPWSNGYSIDGRLNDSFRAVNLLFDKNVAIRRVDKAAAGLRPGDFLIPAGSEAALESRRQADRRRFHSAACAGLGRCARHQAPAHRDVSTLRRRQYR